MELVMLSLLAPLASTSLRTLPPRRIDLVDASLAKLAAVSADVPRALGKELLRHCVQRGLWAQLLTPFQAWLRAGETDLGDEAEGEEAYRMGQIWLVLAPSLRFSLGPRSRGSTATCLSFMPTAV